jgi:hypothetical protein
MDQVDPRRAAAGGIVSTAAEAEIVLTAVSVQNLARVIAMVPPVIAAINPIQKVVPVVDLTVQLGVIVLIAVAGLIAPIAVAGRIALIAGAGLTALIEVADRIALIVATAAQALVMGAHSLIASVNPKLKV